MYIEMVYDYWTWTPFRNTIYATQLIKRKEYKTTNLIYPQAWDISCPVNLHIANIVHATSPIF